MCLKPWKAEYDFMLDWCDIEFDDFGVISSNIQSKSDHRCWLIQEPTGDGVGADSMGCGQERKVVGGDKGLRSQIDK
jgi:hypothetical protein